MHGRGHLPHPAAFLLKRAKSAPKALDLMGVYSHGGRGCSDVLTFFDNAAVFTKNRSCRKSQRNEYSHGAVQDYTCIRSNYGFIGEFVLLCFLAFIVHFLSVDLRLFCVLQF